MAALNSRGRSRKASKTRKGGSQSPSSLTSPPPRSRSRSKKRPGKSPRASRVGSRGASKSRVKTKSK
eukprot:757666-Hanusia_phi.AAC.1